MRSSRPIVIAHRGASGYLPEHSLAAKALAHGLGADYLEQDVILSRDDVPIVFHDLTLDELTDVRERFPGRARGDGCHYVLDFTLAELKTLSLNERRDPATGELVYPGRFAGRGALFNLVTLDEELIFVRGLNASRGRTAGVYTEVKSPAWHRLQGHDPSPIVLDTLRRHGYAARGDDCFLQCFDDVELARIRNDLQCDLKLIQLIGENAWGEAATDYDRLRTPAGLRDIATIADGIGVPIARVAGFAGNGRAATATSLTADAHAAGLAVHPYTLRADKLPEGAASVTEVHEALFVRAGVDGLFSDFCDLTLNFIDSIHRGHP